MHAVHYICCIFGSISLNKATRLLVEKKLDLHLADTYSVNAADRQWTVVSAQWALDNGQWEQIEDSKKWVTDRGGQTAILVRCLMPSGLPK
jgi:hypothetical protein